MKKRVLPIVVGIGSVAFGCGDPASQDKPGATAEKSDHRAGASSSASPTKQLPTVVTRDQLKEPVQLGGAPMPIRPGPVPAASGSPSGGAASQSQAPRSPAPAQPSPAPQAPAVGAAPAPANEPVEQVSIVHNHAAGEPCTPISKGELEKAFGDLKKP